MGPKLLAAFGVGALVATGVLLIVQHSASPPHQPMVISSVAPPPPPESVATPPEPIAPPAPKPVTKKKREKRFRNVAASRASQPPAPAAISLPDPEPTEPPPTESPDVSGVPIAAADTSTLAPPQRHTVTVPSGTLLQVRLNERLASDRNLIGDAFAATLDQPLVVDGYVIAEKGARVLGRIADVIPAGRVQGVAQMALELSSINTADGQKVTLRTARFVRKGDTSHRDDAVKVGAGAAIGAVIGAIAGGGKGAAIGAAAGGGAGTAAVLATRGKAAVLDAETRLSFRLDAPVLITER